MTNCEHRYVTSYGKGWVCCACKCTLLSLMLPIVIATPKEPK
jgi:hypothetical protein